LVFSRECGDGGTTAHRLMVMDTSTGDTWEFGEGRDPDWGPCLSSLAQHCQ
jgi:hypothetical protein